MFMLYVYNMVQPTLQWVFSAVSVCVRTPALVANPMYDSELCTSILELL